MVLAAAPKQAMVWGFCPPGSTVDVSIGSATVRATIGPGQGDGSHTTWRALLPATKGGFDKHNITATSAGTTLTLTDVLFGEVWVCSGQSNMEYPIGNNPSCWNASNINCTDRTPGVDHSQCSFGCSQNAGAEIAAMKKYDEGMRLFNVNPSSQITPHSEMNGGSGWLAPSKMGGKFSAVCWYFGRDVYNAMPKKVPVALISAFVGGTPDQHWSSPDALQVRREA
jgi:sialate O-acetylesterase